MVYNLRVKIQEIQQHEEKFKHLDLSLTDAFKEIYELKTVVSAQLVDTNNPKCVFQLFINDNN